MAKKIKMRMEVQANGKISFFTESGTFADGEKTIVGIFEILEAEGVDFSEILPVEQHRHDDDGQHLHAHNFKEVGS